MTKDTEIKELQMNLSGGKLAERLQSPLSPSSTAPGSKADEHSLRKKGSQVKSQKAHTRVASALRGPSSFLVSGPGQ